jgi:hypothetical protein
VPLTEIAAGVFESTITATLSGLYRFRIVAAGTSMRGMPFTREQLLTGAVFDGGDNPDTPPTSDDNQLCRLINCLLKDDGIQRYLKEHHIDGGSLIETLDSCCRHSDR